MGDYKPIDQKTQHYNVDILQRLKTSHQATVREFLLSNQSVLQELADELLEKRSLALPEIEPFFQQMVLTDGLPKIQELPPLVNTVANGA